MLNNISSGAVIFTSLFWGGALIFTVIQIHGLSRQKKHLQQMRNGVEGGTLHMGDLFDQAQKAPSCAGQCRTPWGEDEPGGQTVMMWGESEQTVLYTDQPDKSVIVLEFLQIAGKPSSLVVRQRGHFLSVGRSQECSVRLEDTTVSRHHADIICENDQIYIRDHGSANHTYVDKQMAEAGQMTRVARTSIVEMGHTKFRVYSRTEAEE